MEYRIPKGTQAVQGIPVGKLNDINSRLSYVEAHYSNGLINISNPDPVGVEGKLTINSSTNEMKVYYSGQWIVLHTLNVINSLMLMETGDFLLLETGDKIIL